MTSTGFDISSRPSIAANRSGSVVVGWIQQQMLWLRFFGRELRPLGEPFDTGSEGSSAALAMDSAGSVIASASTATEFADAPIVGRRFDLDGTPRGGEFQLAVGNGPPAVAPLGRGRFVVVWRQGDALHARTVRW